jgi:hypothetical protein
LGDFLRIWHEVYLIGFKRAGGPDGLGDTLKGPENASPEGYLSEEARLKPGQMELTFRFA